MSCTNCYNGCVEITSDKCVRYTGIEIPLLGINNGDSLAVVEQAIFTFLSTVVNGSGINPNMGSICSLISDAFPPGEDITLNVLLQAISDVICDLNDRITITEAAITTLNDDYDVDCLSGVTDQSDTHDVLQAVIDKLCTLDSDLTALAADLDANYYTAVEVQDYVAAQLAAISVTTYYYKQMVPYVAYPYFGSVTAFGVTGAGSGAWEKVYICNGENGTPDMRGFSPVGATTNSAGGALDPIVASASYNVGDKDGALTVTLSAAQMPTHTHSANVTVTVPAHTHIPSAGYYMFKGDTKYLLDGGGGSFYFLIGSADNRSDSEGLSTNPEQTLTATATINNAGSSQSHDNVPPVRACYFIMYIP